MNLFRVHLMRTLQHHLESEECRYTDNSYNFFMGCREAAEEDALLLRTQPPPTFREFLRREEAAVRDQIEHKSALYDLLADDASRQTLVTVAAYALLGHRLVRFPYYRPDTLARMAELHRQAQAEDPDREMRRRMAEGFFCVPSTVRFYDLAPLGRPLRMYTDPVFLYALSRDENYRYAEGGEEICVRPGDCVLDCGGALGDGALEFALKAGKGGRVVSFEPNAYPYLIFHHALSCNPALNERITLLDRATADRPGGMAAFSLGGFGSSFRAEGAALTSVPLTSIDHEVGELGLSRVDFIKMDIEGAELLSLQGAEATLRRFRPRLAICVYHKKEDCSTIPGYLAGLDLGYRFYLKHHFMNGWETVLYAVA